MRGEQEAAFFAMEKRIWDRKAIELSTAVVLLWIALTFLFEVGGRPAAEARAYANGSGSSGSTGAEEASEKNLALLPWEWICPVHKEKEGEGSFRPLKKNSNIKRI